MSDAPAQDKIYLLPHERNDSDSSVLTQSSFVDKCNETTFLCSFITDLGMCHKTLELNKPLPEQNHLCDQKICIPLQSVTRISHSLMIGNQ